MVGRSKPNWSPSIERRTTMTFQRYRDDIETIQPDEQETIDGIIQGMT